MAGYGRRTVGFALALAGLAYFVAAGRGAPLATYKISGYVRTEGGAAAAGVSMNGGPAPRTTDVQGYYEIDVSSEWSGTITPASPGCKFTPPRRTYIQVQQDFPQQDYVLWQGLDLRAASLTYFVGRPNPVTGETIPITVTIVNDGTLTGLAPRVDIWKDLAAAPTSPAGSDDHRILADLDADDSVEVTFHIVYSQPGTYTLWALVTPGGGQTDRAPANNACPLILEVKPPAPDLVVERTETLANHPPGGRDFTVGVTIRNQGPLDAGGFRVDLWKPGANAPLWQPPLDSQNVLALAAGRTVTLSFDVSYPASGIYTLQVLVDPAFSVAELKEDNNSASLAIEVNGVTGDINGDGQVDVTDLMLVVNAMDTFWGNPGWNPQCDLNQDNAVDDKDLMIVYDNYGRKMLSGTWHGNAQYTVTPTPGTAYSFWQEQTLTFSVSSRPYALDLCLGDGQEVVWMGTEGLISPNDQAVFHYLGVDPAGGGLLIKDVIATVVDVSYKARTYSIDLHVTVLYSGAWLETMSGAYRREAQYQPDGTIGWQGTMTIASSGLAPVPQLASTWRR